MSKYIKIAIYSGEIPSTTFIERLITGLANKGKHIYVFGPKKLRTSKILNVTEVSYKLTKLSKGLHFLKYSALLFFFKRKQKAKLDTIIKQRHNNRLNTKVKFYPVLWHQPDIFHLQWAKGLSDWIWVKDFNIKLVLSLRGAHINYSPIADKKLADMYREYFPKVDAFHAVSKSIAQEAQKYLAPKEKIRVIYSGLDMSQFSAKTKIADSKMKILSVGRPHWVKGYTYAIDACKILKDANLNFEYTIVGGTPDIELTYQIHDLELQNHVCLLGKLPFKDVQNHIRSADLVLLPSIKEGLANVVLEAMACKTLVLTTDCGGMKEVINDGQNGLMVPIRNAEKMAKKILDISTLSQEQKTEIKDQAYQKINEQHHESKMIDDMLELYNNL